MAAAVTTEMDIGKAETLIGVAKEVALVGMGVPPVMGLVQVTCI